MDELMQLLRNRVPSGITLATGTPLISSGLIDSFALADLLSAFERHFRVSIDAADIGADNFDTPAQMHEFLSRHQ